MSEEVIVDMRCVFCAVSLLAWNESTSCTSTGLRGFNKRVLFKER